MSELPSDIPIEREQSLKDKELPMSEMTKQEYAAILLRVPVSGTKWLDNMIAASLDLQMKTSKEGATKVEQAAPQGIKMRRGR